MNIRHLSIQRESAMLGDRLHLARKRTGMSLRALEDAISGKVSAQALSKYERGEMTPSSDVLIALSRALKVPVPYLLAVEEVKLGEVDFRTRASTSAKDRGRVEAAVLEWVERYLQLERILGIDSASWSAPFAQPRRLRSIDEAEGLADEVRVVWELGIDPIPNLTELLEEKGLKVLLEDLPDSVSGFTCLVQRPGGLAPVPVIVANTRKSLERRRLTLAHELAHRVIDPANLSERDEELAMTRFAGAFLMPRAHIVAEVGERRNLVSYRELIDLKRIYRVSGAALLVRLRDLRVIDQANLTYAFQTVARGWRSQEPEELEPAQERGQREKPRRLRRLCMRAVAEKLISLLLSRSTNK
jgi:Zn-dependent peptidase ImmA (M78 family)/DNA-binding XRE family transcriptional regulator